MKVDKEIDLLQLFMGILFESHLEKKLSHPLAIQFIEKEKLLKKVILNHETMYLGKPIPASHSMEQLLDLQKHIISLLSRLLPGYPIGVKDIKIFAYVGE